MDSGWDAGILFRALQGHGRSRLNTFKETRILQFGFAAKATSAVLVKLKKPGAPIQ